MPSSPSRLPAQSRLFLQPSHLRTRTHCSTMATAPPLTRPIKILMLHGYTQSGPLFQAKTGALRKTLQKAFPAGIELVYPTAPIRLTPADESFLAGQGTGQDAEGQGEKGDKEQEIDAWAWWRRKESSKGEEEGEKSYTYDGIELSFSALARILKADGPFDGVIGFSQGAAAAAMLASLLEPNRRAAFEAQYSKAGMQYPASFTPQPLPTTTTPTTTTTSTSTSSPAIHPPLKFAVSYSGFAPQAPNSPYTAFYTPPIRTPVLHFLGSQDVVVDEQRSLALVAACERREHERYVVYHPGGHFLPGTQKACVNALVGFIREVLGREEGANSGDVDVDVGVEGAF